MTHMTSTCSTSNFSGGGESRPEGSSRGALVLFKDMVMAKMYLCLPADPHKGLPLYIVSLFFCPPFLLSPTF